MRKYLASLMWWDHAGNTATGRTFLTASSALTQKDIEETEQALCRAKGARQMIIIGLFELGPDSEGDR